MFTVYDKKEFRDHGIVREYCVYDIVYDKSGYPLFLIKQNGQWLKRSAKYFLTKEEVYSRHTD